MAATRSKLQNGGSIKKLCDWLLFTPTREEPTMGGVEPANDSPEGQRLAGWKHGLNPLRYPPTPSRHRVLSSFLGIKSVSQSLLGLAVRGCWSGPVAR
ncbi:hypothetical protein LSTR_LSTR014073 [Laodelphax striatellus]|uniref:Uncharacterized protein n=1 Tax=Laodelphax striatellus TaxID=195883 RepID=A0A482WHQ9_LAOST|nr:hypothetical protein LSTR_LSTR014073 [Laodelphax striatellus]